MKFDANLLEYLKGNLFSNGLEVTISEKESIIPDRFSVIEQLVPNKKIIHLGCCDHIPLIKQKIQNNIWLHSRLCNNSKICLGVDINKDGVEYLRAELGYNDVICADLLYDEVPEIKRNQWDYLVMGEILEHVDNPVMFLNAIRAKYKENIEKLIISVPNAFCWLNFKSAFKHKECINTDHRYWFTPYTLAKVIMKAGLQVENFYFCEPFPLRYDWKSKLNVKTNLSRIVLKTFPALRETLIMIARV